MREFRDNEGRPWQLALTVNSALRVRDTVRASFAKIGTDRQPTGETEERAVDLLDTSNAGQTLQLLRSNFAVLGEVLYAVLSPQVEAKAMNREDFLGGLAGDSLDSGRTALEEELVSFFPSRLRGILSAMRERMAAVETEMVAEMTATIQTVGLPTAGASSGSAPGLSASTPENGPSVNSSPQPAAG